jgi:hypothetical protein
MTLYWIDKFFVMILVFISWAWLEKDKAIQIEDKP